MSRMTIFLKTLGEPSAIGLGMWKIASGDFVNGLKNLGGVVGYEGASRFLASEMGNRILQWGATHGPIFAQNAAREGLTAPVASDIIEGNEMDTGSGIANTNGNNPEFVAGNSNSVRNHGSLVTRGFTGKKSSQSSSFSYWTSSSKCTSTPRKGA